jgi:hypothetical protein
MAPNGSGTFLAISCSAPTFCTAAGESGYDQPMLAVETAGTWASPIVLGATGSGAEFTGVSCSDATDCTAVGGDAFNQPFYVTETAGTWGSPNEIPITGASGSASAVSCSSADNCVAVGGDDGTNKAFYSIDSSGTWAPSVEVTTTGTTGVFNGVSCPDGTYCTAVGYDEGTNEPFYDIMSQSSTQVTHPTSTTTTTTTTTTTLPTTTTTLRPTPPGRQALKLTVSFATGSAVLNRAGRIEIEKYVKVVLSKDRHLIVVTGYASSKGSRKTNQDLIEQRAAVVAQYVHQTLRLGGGLNASVKVQGGGIRRMPSQLRDQVAILSA